MLTHTVAFSDSEFITFESTQPACFLNMGKEHIHFKIIFRSPEYPVIIISADDLSSASNIEQLGKLCVLSEPSEDDDKVRVIDSTGEEFWYLPEHFALSPGFFPKKWTKKQIVDLFNRSVNAKEKNIQYPLKSLSNKRLSKIIVDICEILS